MDLFAHWRYTYQPGKKLVFMIIELIVGVAIGFIPCECSCAAHPYRPRLTRFIRCGQLCSPWRSPDGSPGWHGSLPNNQPVHPSSKHRDCVARHCNSVGNRPLRCSAAKLLHVRSLRCVFLVSVSLMYTHLGKQSLQRVSHSVMSSLIAILPDLRARCRTGFASGSV